MFYTLHYEDGSTVTVAIDAIESLLVDEECALLMKGSDEAIPVTRDEAMRLREWLEQLR